MAAVREIDDEASWAPTGCTGWAARDLVFHCLTDAQRALRRCTPRRTPRPTGTPSATGPTGGSRTPRAGSARRTGAGSPGRSPGCSCTSGNCASCTWRRRRPHCTPSTTPTRPGAWSPRAMS
ncbi:maleylpyruvate isomerase N-terminal domain-containing protein [Streptomyces lavendulocolor]|uniref:maleylpyruvate isomerase N-terminal domain-containing protein n=1 Tax=Streptomyces lavendulocolor TaxID=67316 RepID=UPI003C2ABD0F